MTITVQAPNGVSVDFPEGTDADTISKVMRQATGAETSQPAAPTPEQPKLSDLDKRMDARVAKEAASGLAPHPSPAQYLPFGSWLDEASAGIDAGLNKISDGRFGAPYDEAKAYQDARQRYIDKNASGIEKGAAMAGGVVASAPFGAVRVFRGEPSTPGEDVQQGAVGTGSLDFAVKGFALKLAA